MERMDFVDLENNDLRLKSTSASINAGVAIPGINDNSVGAPDIGAFEYKLNTLFVNKCHIMVNKC